MNPPIPSSASTMPYELLPATAFTAPLVEEPDVAVATTEPAMIDTVQATEAIVWPSEFVATSSDVLARADTPINQEPSRLRRIAEFVGRHKTKALLGLTALSASVTLLADPFEETKDAVLDAAPWVASGIAVSEAAFVAGAAMMLSAIGSKIPLNPLKIKEKMGDIARKANDSILFKAGFAVNTAGALGDFVVLSTGVVRELPVHSWGMLGFSLADLGVTIAVRRAIVHGVHAHAHDPVAVE